MKDIHSFLANDKIRDRDVLLLFSRFGDSGAARMTYLSYLSMLKPYFDHELARDLLLRDTVAHGKGRGTINS
jgi:ABC-type sulfate transport system substrate-binding protein